MSKTKLFPYIGPRTFLKEEGYLFFGREREARDLLALVVSERLVLFYAQSGAGKSSLINTCLIPNLESKGFEVLPVGRVSGDLPPGHNADNIFAYNLAHSLLQRETAPKVLADIPSLSVFLSGLIFDEAGYFYSNNSLNITDKTYLPQRRTLIIDQFEELFSTHPGAWEKREDFFRQLARAMEDDPYLWVVLVMREDYIAAMDPYAYLLPGSMRTRYYMQRLNRESALKAVRKPVESLRPFAEGVAEKLVDDLCSIKVQKPDGTLDNQPGQYVEPVQLQVVCFSLWENLPSEGTEITEKDLQDVGDVDQSLGKYYEGRVNAVAIAKGVKERLIREWFEKKLIAPGGIRNMVLQERDGKSSGIADEVIQALQSDLVRAEKRGGVTWYELTHDRLVEPILESNKKWFNENLSPLQRQTTLWKDQNQDESWLLRDSALVEVEEWAKDHQDELTDAEREFIMACQKMRAQIEERKAAERHELEMANKLAAEQTRSAQRAMRFNVISLVLILIALSASVFAFITRNAAIDSQNVALTAQSNAQDQSEIARSGELSTIALERFSSQLDLAILLGLEADSIKSTPQTQKTLLALLQKSGRYVGSIKGDEYIQEIQYSPDGKIFASRDKSGVMFWNADTLQPLNDVPINGHFSGITALAISKDGKIMASGASDGTIVIWDAVNRQPFSKPIKAHNTQVSSLAFSVDGKTLASASIYETAILLWDISDPVSPQRVDESLLKHTSGILSLAFSPNGKTLASGGYDYTVILWDLATREAIGEPIRTHTSSVNKVVFNSKSTILISASDDSRIILWDVKDPAAPKNINVLQNGTGYPVRGLAISSDDQLLASGNSDSLIILWNISDPENPVKIEERVVSQINYAQLAFNTDNKTIALSAYDGSVVLVDIGKREPIGEPVKGGTKSMSAVVFGPDGKTMITSSYDSTILFWDVSDRENPRKIGKPLQVHPGQPFSIYFSSDGTLLASQGDDGTFLLDVETQKQIGVGSFLTSPDGNILAYLTLDEITNESTIHLMNTETKETIGDSILGYSPFFSPDSEKLVFLAYDKDGKSQYHLWDIAGNKELYFPASDQYPIFSPDSKTLVYQTTDLKTNQNLLNLWDIATEKNIGTDIKGFYLTINPDSQTLVYKTFNSDTGEALINVWDIAKAFTIKSVVSSYPVISKDGKVLAFVTSDPVNGQFINLLDTATGNSITQPVAGGGINFLSANGKIMFYSSWNSINVLNAVTGENLFSGSINTNRIAELGHVLVCEFNDYSNNGETNILLIDTITGQKIGEPIKGTYLKLSQNGEFLVYQTTGQDGIKINLFDVTNAAKIGEPIPGNYMTISGDGKTYATRSEANTIIFWDSTKSWPFGKPIMKPSEITSSSLSLDGSTLAWVDKDGITLQDISNDTLVRGPFMNHFKNADLNSVSISPNGKLIAIANIKDSTNGSTGTITLWDIATGKPIDQPIDEAFYAIFSPDSKTLITFSQTGTSIWDITDMTHVKAVGDPIPGFLASFSPDSKRLVIGGDSENQTLKIWDLDANKLINDSIPGIYATFSPNSKILAAVGEDSDKTAIWDMTTFKLIDDSIPGGGFICFSPNGDSLAVGNSESNSTTLWDLATLKAISDPIPGSFPVRFSQDGKVLVIAEQDLHTTILWDLSTHKQIGDTFTGSYFSSLMNLPYAGSSSDDKVLAFYDEDRNAMLWNVETNTKLNVPKYPGEISGINLNQNGPFFNNLASLPTANILAIYGNRGVMLWDLDNNKELGKLIHVAGSVIPATSVIVSPNGKIVASLAEDSIVVRDLETNIDTYLESSTQLTSNMVFSLDSMKLVALDVGNTLIAWDVSTGEQTAIERQPLENISVIDPVFSPDGKYLAYESNIDGNTNLHIWDIVTGKPYIENPIELNDLGQEITFSTDGSLMAYNDGAKIVLYNLLTKEQTGDMLTELTGGISRLSMIMDDDVVKYIVSADSHGDTQIWDWATRTKIGDSMSGSLKIVGSDSQDHTVIYIDSSGRLIKWKWNLSHEEWKDLLCPLAKRNFTQEEWRLYFPGEEYSSVQEFLTCPDYPRGE